MSIYKKNLLFVDDEVRILRTLKAMFRRDYHVHLANSGREALSILDHKKMDVVISDQRMPEMLGNELLSRVRAIQPQAIRMLLTGYMDKRAILKTINEGEIFRFISKPWDSEEIKEIVSEAATASEIEHIDLQPEIFTDALNNKAIDNRQRWQENGIVKPAILVLEKDSSVRIQIKEISSKIGIKTYFVNKISGAVGVLHLRPNIGTIVLSMDDGFDDTITALALMRRVRPSLITIVLAEMTDSEVAVDLINHSQVFRYLDKPIENDNFEKLIVDGLIRHDQLKNNEAATKRYEADYSKIKISSIMKKIFSIFSNNTTH
jgi:DNA-binding NtrC family response regulator